MNDITIWQLFTIAFIAATLYLQWAFYGLLKRVDTLTEIVQTDLKHHQETEKDYMELLEAMQNTVSELQKEREETK